MNNFEEYSPFLDLIAGTNTSDVNSPVQHEFESYSPFRNLDIEASIEQAEPDEQESLLADEMELTDVIETEDKIYVLPIEFENLNLGYQEANIETEWDLITDSTAGGISATDISVGTNNSIWIISNMKIGNDYKIFQWNGTDWNPVDGAALRIAVAPGGNPWVVNSMGQIFYRSENSWRLINWQVPCIDLSIGANASFWAIGGKKSGNDYEIFYWNGTIMARVDGAGIKIAVDKDGIPWVVNSSGKIFRRDGNAWTQIHGIARDIGIGAENSVWVIGNDKIGTNYSIYKWDDIRKDWQPSDGTGVAISVDSDGLPYVLNASGEIYKLKKPATSSPSCDLSIAVTQFEPSLCQKIVPDLLTPLKSKEAIEWNKAWLAKISIDPIHIRTDLERYIDLLYVRRAIDAFNKMNPTAMIDLGNGPIDAVYAEAIHQFQKKIYFDPKKIDGKGGSSTLHSLGIISFKQDSVFVNTDAKHQLRILGIKVMINGVECNHTNWFNYTYNPSFLGITFKTSVHYLLIRQLRIAENFLLGLQPFKGKNIIELAASLGLSNRTEKHAGGREHKPGHSSMHEYGLAIDIDHSGNPWVGAGWISGSAEATKFLETLVNAAAPGTLSVSQGKVFEYLDSIGIRLGANTYTAFNELKKRSNEFIAYLKTTTSQLTFWQRSATFDKRDPLNGFLNFDPNLVYALRQHAGLGWGAIDFGDSASGDIMHFDMRTMGVGREINTRKTPKGADPVNSHPLLRTNPCETIENIEPELQQEFYLEENESLFSNEFDIDQKYGITDYLNVSVGDDLQAKTGVFLPTGYKKSGYIDVVVFLHGHLGKTKDKKWISDKQFLKGGIEHYWKNYSNIREYFMLNSNNAILIAPTLGDRSSEKYGQLGNKGGFDNFLLACFHELTWVKKYLSPTNSLPYRIILAAHSGGGNPMGKILSQENAFNKHVVKVWGFDCLYGEISGNWVNNYDKWLNATTKSNPKKLFFHFWATSTPRKNGDYLQKLHPDQISNVSPAAKMDHKSIIDYAWKNEINKFPIFDPFAGLQKINAVPQYEDVLYEGNDESELESLYPDAVINNEFAETGDYDESDIDDYTESDIESFYNETIAEDEIFNTEDYELGESNNELIQLQVTTSTQGLASILYGGFDLQAGDKDSSSKYGGGVSSTYAGKRYVAQLQDDLRTLGFGYVGATSDGQFGTNTQIAVREFQIYAKMNFLALQTQNVSRVYSDSLIQGQNTSVYTGPASGVVNAVTRTLIQLWLQNNWRCPVIIEAWTMAGSPAARNAIAHHNLWKYDDLRDTAPRMFGIDFSNYYQSGMARMLTDRQVLGDYSQYGSWSGPGSAPPKHTWPEAEIFPNKSIFPALNPATPAFTQLTPLQQSTFRVIRAVSEVECNAFYDGLNAYDNVYISIPPFHAVLGETNDAYGGELGGFISYFAEYFPIEFNRLFGFCGIKSTTDWNTNGSALFKPSRRFTSVLSIQNENGTFTSINTTNQTIYHWFRSWHWFYRFAMAGRTSPIYQRALWCYARIRLRGLLDTPWDNTLQVSYMNSGVLKNRTATIGDIFTSEKAVAILLRWHVRYPAHIANGNVAGTVLKNAVARSGMTLSSILGNALTDEQILVDKLVAQVTSSSFNSTITYVRNWPEWAPRTINAAGGKPNYRHFTLDLAFCNALSTSRNANGFPLDRTSLPPPP